MFLGLALQINRILSLRTKISVGSNTVREALMKDNTKHEEAENVISYNLVAPRVVSNFILPPPANAIIVLRYLRNRKLFPCFYQVIRPVQMGDFLSAVFC